MKRVSQEHHNGCGIACVAMIAGVTYGEAQTAIFGKRRVRVKRTRARHLQKAFRKLGIDSSKLIELSQHLNYKNLKRDAILKVKSLRSKGRMWHWIVWDAKREAFIDPVKRKRDRYVRPPVRAYLKIRR